MLEFPDFANLGFCIGKNFIAAAGEPNKLASGLASFSLLTPAR
jgi:hypothetical protein